MIGNDSRVAGPRCRATTALAIAAVLLVAACGSDDSASGGTAGTDAPPAASDPQAPDATGSVAAGEPVKLVLLWEIAGESDVAVDDLQHGAELAISRINADGGINGRPVEATRIAANPLDPQSTTAALREARDENPAAMVGLVVNSQAATAVSQIDQTGIPLVMVAQANDNVIYGGPSGSEWLWAAQPHSSSVAEATIDHLVEEQGHDRIGLLGTNDEFGATLLDASKERLADHGLEAYAERVYPPDATDLSEQVLAMDGADVAVNWGYPNTLALQLQQFQQQGLDLRTYDGPSAPIVVQSELAPPEAIESLRATVPCNPDAPDSPEMQEFVESYVAAHDAVPSFTAASAHDAVTFVAAALGDANSLDPAAVNDAISSTQVTAACGDYAADDAHVLLHKSTIVEYTGDGASTNAATYELPPVAAGS